MRDGVTNLQYGITSDIIRHGGVLERWVVESGLSVYTDADIDKCYLKHLIKAVTPLYTCNRPPGAAGAMIVMRDKIIYGWVSPTESSPSCKVNGCEIEDGHCVRNLHAEVQAIIRAARRGLSTEQATIYSILKPCYNCSKAIIHAGIRRIYYAGAAYDEKRTQDILDAAGVYIEYLDAGLEYGND